ncbi:MAG: GNAT family N-acetyltransferase [Coriobacteriales bacterium]|nr:GNAT family N-acetyltransferase [Coriobacteriales bacterium]
MTLHFVPVHGDQDQERLAELAAEIWRGYWPALIGLDQTEYMIENFQSLSAIKRDMAEHGYEYWFLVADGDEVSDEEAASLPHGRVMGYTGGRVEPETNRFFISKIYLLPEARGRHFASRAIGFYGALCQCRGLSAMYLTVNKGNVLGIRAYEGNGFVTIDAVETDIGSGFIMDDFIMEKRVR